MKSAVDKISIDTPYSDRQQVSLVPTLLTVPIEIVYRILDHLDDYALFCCAQNVCTHLNDIINTYNRYNVSIYTTKKLATFSFLVKIHSTKELIR